MQVYFLWSAVIVSIITFYIHTFIGGPRVAKPLLENKSLSKASKWLNNLPCRKLITDYKHYQE